MVDLDFDDSEEYLGTTKLFVTDTHDLETLLLSTDCDLFRKLKKCVVSDSDANKAFFMAYQIGVLKKVLYQYVDKDFKLCFLAANEVDYTKVFQENLLSLENTLKFLNEKNSRILSETKIKRIYDRCLEDKKLKKLFDSNGIWKLKIEEFKLDTYVDFWDIVNGHDILAILKFVNYEAAVVYTDDARLGLNRDFELDLISNYDYSTFKQTSLYANMIKETIIKQCI